MRGSVIMAVAERKVSATQRGLKIRSACNISGDMREKISAGPSLRPQTTKMPTASRAKSFTNASSAMAVTTPWWRSLASTFRVPNRMVNTARTAAIQNADTFSSANPVPSVGENTEKLVVMDCSCRAIYGVDPITANSVTTTPRVALLP